MAITKWDPFGDVEGFPPMRFFQDAVSRLLSEPPASRPWAPPVDIFETENELVVKADLPDVDQKDIDINVENGTLALKGERRFEKKTDNQGYHRIERSYGSFVRYFGLPDSVDTEKVRAEYKNGVLTVTLPKKEAAKPRAIKVEVTN